MSGLRDDDSSACFESNRPVRAEQGGAAFQWVDCASLRCQAPDPSSAGAHDRRDRAFGVVNLGEEERAPSDANAMPANGIWSRGSGTRRNCLSSSVRHSCLR